MKLRNLVLGLFVLVIMAGCGDVTPTPAVSIATVTSGGPTSSGGTTPMSGTIAPPSRITPGDPAFTFLPKTIMVGSNVRMTGANFAPGSTVVVRIGNPEPIGEPLSSALVDINGHWLITFLMPANLPSGQKITSGDYQFVMMDQNNQIMTRGPFKFVEK